MKTETSPSSSRKYSRRSKSTTPEKEKVKSHMIQVEPLKALPPLSLDSIRSLAITCHAVNVCKYTYRVVFIIAFYLNLNRADFK